jgi:hypothetical protein
MVTVTAEAGVAFGPTWCAGFQDGLLDIDPMIPLWPMVV